MSKIISKILSILLITLVFLSGEGMTLYYHICKIDNTADISIITQGDFHNESEHRHSHDDEYTTENCCNIIHKDGCCSLDFEHHKSVDRDCCEKIAKNNILEPVSFNPNEGLKIVAAVQPTITYEQLNLQPLFEAFNYDIEPDITPDKIIHNTVISFINHKSTTKSDIPSIS